MKINRNIINYILVGCCILASFATYVLVFSIKSPEIPNPDRVIGLVLVDVILLFVITIILIRNFFQLVLKKRSRTGFKLQRNIVLMFCVVAGLPTIIGAVFSVFFFQKGLQTWFDKQVVTALEQAFFIAESYIKENQNKMKKIAISMANDFDGIYYNAPYNYYSLQDLLNAHSTLRSLDEAIIFQINSRQVLAQTSLSFALIFSTIQNQDIEKAKMGEVVMVHSDPNKIRILIQINKKEQIYLLIGKLLDKKIIDYVKQTDNAASTYRELSKNMSMLSIKFSIIFIVQTMLLLLAAMTIGIIFANSVVKKLQKLLQSTERVQRGDLTVEVKISHDKNDELSILAEAFNNMVRKLARQRRELVVAQRALVWSDVARRVAHEIKNPLTPILLSSERLISKFSNEVKDKEMFMRYVNSILRNTKDITSIVTEFTNFAKMPDPKFEKLDLVALLDNIIKTRQSLDSKVEYIFHFDSKIIDFICDSGQISQVINNLLNNSVEALERIKQPKVKINVLYKPQIIKIIIEDNGVGFRKDLMNQLIEPYVTTSAKGMGLGLTIVQKIVDDHCGIIKIGNNEEVGAYVELKFDLQKLNFKLNN